MTPSGRHIDRTQDRRHLRQWALYCSRGSGGAPRGTLRKRPRRARGQPALQSLSPAVAGPSMGQRVKCVGIRVCSPSCFPAGGNNNSRHVMNNNNKKQLISSDSPLWRRLLWSSLKVETGWNSPVRCFLALQSWASCSASGSPRFCRFLRI